MSVRRRASGRVHYNYFRDYDPAKGGYIESDPIGLGGGGYSTYAYAQGNPIMARDPSGLLVRGDWDNDQEWQDIENAANKIRAEIGKGCSCTKNGGMGSCIPCDLVPALLNSLDTMIVSYAPLLRIDDNTGKLVADCGFTQPVKHPRGLFLSEVPWGKVPGRTCKPSCLTAVLYHELLHTTGKGITDTSKPPAAVYEDKCIGDLCKKSSP